MSDDWRANAPDGSKYGLNPDNYSSEQAYLYNYDRATHKWRENYYFQNCYGLDLNDFDNEDDFIAALNENKYKIEHNIELMPLEHATKAYYYWLKNFDKEKVKGIQPYAFFQINGENYPWFVEWDENRPSRLNDLRFSLPGMPAFHTNQVRNIHFLVKIKNPFTINHKEYASYYHYQYYSAVTIKDTDEFYMIVCYMESPTIQSYGIYDKFTLLYTIRDIDRLEFNPDCFHPSFFVGYKYRANKIYYLINGKRYEPDELDMPFKEWCLCFGEPKLLDAYSLSNQISADMIRWNADIPVKWEIPPNNDNGTFIESLAERTHIYYGGYRIENNLIRGEDSLAPFLDTTSEIIKTIIESIKGTISKEQLGNAIIEKIYDFISKGLAGDSWIGLENCSHESVEAVVPYPYGKHGDIDHYLAETYGNISEIDGAHCKITIPCNEYEIIALLAESFNYDQSGMCDFSSTLQFMNDHNVFYACMDMLWYCSDHGLLRSSSPLWRAVNNLKNEYRAILRKRRNEVYSDIIRSGKSHYRWKTEGAVYGIIRGAYPDAVYQYHSEWLGYQSLDVFIPSIKVGVEYNGIQHYEPVSFFGGEESFSARQKLDEQKRRLCEDNGIALLEIRYDDSLTKNDILNRINELADKEHKQ